MSPAKSARAPRALDYITARDARKIASDVATERCNQLSRVTKAVLERELSSVAESHARMAAVIANVESRTLAGRWRRVRSACSATLARLRTPKGAV